MSLIILRDINNQQIDTAALSLKGLKIHIPAPSYERIVERADGRGGILILDKVLRPREIIAEFFTQARDYADSLLLRDEIFTRLDGDFFFSESYQPQKRWRVHTNEWTPERFSPTASTLSIPLTAPLGLSESVGTTLDSLTFDAEKWQVGQGLILEEPKYVHSTNTFRIFNAGDVTVDPRQFPLKVIFRGASTNLKIKNQTNGDEWQYNGTSTANDTITLDGVRSLKNDVSIFGKTNKRLLSLEPGWNDIQLSGTSGSFLISFEHRFYYL